jgi:hypothetical protein
MAVAFGFRPLSLYFKQLKNPGNRGRMEQVHILTVHPAGEERRPVLLRLQRVLDPQG